MKTESCHGFALMKEYLKRPRRPQSRSESGCLFFLIFQSNLDEFFMVRVGSLTDRANNSARLARQQDRYDAGAAA